MESRLPIAAWLVLLAACAQIPTGPSVSVLPPPGKPFDVFVADDKLCRSYATQAIDGTSPSKAATDSALISAAVGTALGAAVGAIAGGGEGAGAGAAIGAVGGTVVGLGEAESSRTTVQRRYDITYQQCMYGRGNVLAGESTTAYVPPPPPTR